MPEARTATERKTQVERTVNKNNTSLARLSAVQKRKWAHQSLMQVIGSALAILIGSADSESPARLAGQSATGQ
jgi:hypothetical protein